MDDRIKIVVGIIVVICLTLSEKYVKTQKPGGDAIPVTLLKLALIVVPTAVTVLVFGF